MEKKKVKSKKPIEKVEEKKIEIQEPIPVPAQVLVEAPVEETKNDEKHKL